MDIDTWRMAVKSDIMTMVRAPRERLRSITVIQSVHVVRITDDPSADVAADIKRLDRDFRACAMQSGTIKRGTRWAGTAEIDLVHPRMLGSETKQDLIGTLAGIDPETLTLDQRLIVVHAHLVVDCKGHARPAVLERDIRAQWPGPRRVHSAQIYTTGTVRTNLENLASYMTKLWGHYSEAWEGRPTRRLMAREREWNAWMSRLIDNVGLDNMLISSVKSRAAECPLTNAQTLAEQGVEPDAEGHQLTTPIEDTVSTQEIPQHPLNHTETITERQTMRMREIIDTDPIPTQYIDLDRISDEMLRDLQRSLTRSGVPVRTPDLVQAMYSHADDDRRDSLELDLLALDIEARRADIAATQADADQSHADAIKSRAAAFIDLGDLDEDQATM